jgi:hypothetical protein
VPEIHAIQWVQGMGLDQPILQWLPLLKHIRAAGKSLVIDLQLDEFEPFMEIDSFERYQGSSYDFSELPESYVSSLMEGLVGFEMLLDSLEGKFKLGQSWSEPDRRSVLEHIRQPAWHEPSLFDVSLDFYQRQDAH